MFNVSYQSGPLSSLHKYNVSFQQSSADVKLIAIPKVCPIKNDKYGCDYDHG